MTPNLMEAEIDRALLDVARQRIVPRRSHEVGRGLASRRSGRSSAVDVLVTDGGLGPDARSQLEGQVGELVVVPMV